VLRSVNVGLLKYRLKKVVKKGKKKEEKRVKVLRVTYY